MSRAAWRGTRTPKYAQPRLIAAQVYTGPVRSKGSGIDHLPPRGYDARDDDRPADHEAEQDAGSRPRSRGAARDRRRDPVGTAAERRLRRLAADRARRPGGARPR